MAPLFKTAGRISGLLFLAVLTSIKVLAQEKTVQTDVNVDNAPDTGFITGSAWLWLLFVIICIAVVVVLLKKRRNT